MNRGSVGVEVREREIRNVGDLRKVIKGLKDHVELLVRSVDGDNSCHIQSIYYEPTEFLDSGQTATRPALNFILMGKAVE